MRLQPLYKRASTGKTQVWEIEYQEGKFRTHSGQLNGKIKTSEWTICEEKNIGKSNATTVEEQARVEAEAKWKKKTEENYFLSLEEIDNITFKSPMLAEELDDFPDIDYPIWLQPKLDGVRGRVDKGKEVLSRKGKPLPAAAHIRETLNELLTKFPIIKLDGELYNPEFHDNFDAIVSVVRKTKLDEEDTEKAKATIQYWIYDLMDDSMIFSDRWKVIQSIKEYIDSDPERSRVIKFTPTHRVDNEKQLNEWFKTYRKMGYEGVMIRDDTNYEFKRTRHLRKMKDTIVKEFIPIDILEGKGNRSGMAATAVFLTEDGKRFEASIMGSDETRREILRNKDNYINKVPGSVEYQNLTPKGVPRFPRMIAFRDYE